jgi:hypothetical protein
MVSCVCVEVLACQLHSCFKMFLGIIPNKPSRDFTCPLGSPRGLKCLFHMLNAIISFTRKMIYVSCFHFIYFLFCFVKGLAKCKFMGI